MVLGDVQIEKAQQVAASLGAEHAVAVQCDVGKEEDVERLVGTAVEVFKGLDIMVNNAGGWLAADSAAAVHPCCRKATPSPGWVAGKSEK